MADKTAPKSQLRLEWVYGYRGHQTRSNLFYTASKEVVYFVAAVGVVYNERENRQKFFMGHDDDIVSLALHGEKTLVATGQVGKSPYICVWDTMTMKTISILKEGHTQGITSLAFDKEGNRLVSVGMDQNSTVNVWDWRKGKIIATVRGHSDRVFDMQFQPNSENQLVSCGVKHIKFWKLSGNTLKPSKGIFGKAGEIQTMLCLTFGPEDITYTGALNGDIYVWKGKNLSKVIDNAHTGSVFAIAASPDGFVSGSKDGTVRIWDPDFKHIAKIDLSTAKDGYKGLKVRSVYWRSDKILVGTQDSEIFEISTNDKERARCIMQGHAEGELWALAAHPKKPVIASGSDDCTVRLWNMQDKTLLSKTTVEQPVRSVAFNADGSQLAAGMNDGSFKVLKTKDLSDLIHIRDRKEVIHEIKFSPDGQYLAVASNDNFVDIYSVPQKYKKVGQCSGSSSFITHIDWSEDGKYLQTNSGAAERLFFKMPAGKQVTNKEEIRSIHWATWTSVLGPEVNGVWGKYTDTNDINAVDAYFGGEVVVTGDDFGLVKLFRFPSLKKGAKFRKYKGHSAHVTNCRFSADKQRVLTTGGADHAIFQWRFQADGFENDDDDLTDKYGNADSNSEDSDSELSDVDEVDSDLEAETQKTYSRAVYKEDIKVLKSTMKKQMNPGEKRNKAPDDSLKLKFVYGYRGYDCRNNVFYMQNGEVAYHVAAVGILYNKEKRTQRFYTEHDDDILCLAVHPLKDIIATGQVGRDAATHVWDADNLKTLSILKGQHERGVCAADFSPDGKRLATVGLDNEHMIVIWDWRKGEKLAITRGHKDKIFMIKWNPHDGNQLVTVGVKHIKFWTQAGGGFTSKRGTFGNVGKLDTMMCIAYGKAPNICFTGGSNGSIYIWNGMTLSKAIKAHEGPCFSMHSLDKGFVTGGKDGMVSLWDESFERCLKSYAIKRSSLVSGTKGMLLQDQPPIRAIILGHGHILVGTGNGEILEIGKDGPIDILVQGHREGEVWGLSTHPKQQMCATVSDDKTLRIWDLGENHCMVNCKIFKKPARSVDFSPDGKALAVGFKDGSFMVVNSETLDDIVQFHHRKEEISDIRFSPEPGKYLAVSSHDNLVDIYNVFSSKRVGTCKGSSSYITHIDWDTRGKLLMTNSGAKEQLFFEAPRGKRQTLRNEEIEKLDWATWTGVLGKTCEGIWPAGSDVTDVNASDLSNDRRIVATGDDYGYVKLFNYPAKGKLAKFKKYVGHSAHVTNVRWTHDDSHLVSVGGNDTAVMVWSHDNSNKSGYRGDSEDSDTDSEEEGGYDSDVAHEKSIDYSAKTYANPIRGRKGVKPREQLEDSDDEDRKPVSRHTRKVSKVKKSDPVSLSSTGKRSKKIAQVTDLELDYIFGFRGFDCRSNLHYLNDGSDVVYHAAGAGIVLNIASNHQNFYLEHSDDIICLAVNEHPKFKNIVATGQIGVVPEVNIWNATNRETLSTIKGFHKKGVCSVDFSCSGKLLLTIGLDDDHSVAVWRWQEGSKVSSAEGSKERIFHGEFRPDSDSHFVTVGVKHVNFWHIAGSTMKRKKGILAPVDDVAADPKMQTMLSVAFGANNTTFTGAMSGDVYVWIGNTLTRIVQKAHNGPIFSMFTTLRDGLIVTGAKEKQSKDGGAVKLWDQEMRRCRAFQLDTKRQVDVVKSVSRCKGKILVGTKESDLIEVNEKTGASVTLMNGHGEGEMWGLASHPSTDRFVSASDDGTVRMWDIVSKKLLMNLPVGPARSADISPDGELVAVGLKNGGFQILNSTNFKVLAQHRDRGQMINEIRFSPDNRYLAAGSQEGSVDFYDISKGPSMPRSGFCKGLPSFVTQMDFSSDSKYIRVSNGAYDQQVFEVPSGVEVTKKTVLKGITYHSWTSVLGSEAIGIWPMDAEKADVNTADVTHAGNTIVTGDDYGLVKLFNFPCADKYAPHKTYVGHSAHVTNTCFTWDDRYLLTAGGDDCCVFVWKCK